MERKRGITGILLTLFLAAALTELAVKYAGAAVLPFAAAYIGARILRPLGIYLSRKSKVPEKHGCAVFGALVCFALLYGAGVASGILALQLWELIGKLPQYADEAAELFRDIGELLPFSGGRAAEVINVAFVQAAEYMGGAAADFLAKLVASLPSGVFSGIVGIFSFIYMISDPGGIGESIRSLLPESVSERVFAVFGSVSDAVFGYLRAYLIIMSVTFVELAVGLYVVGAAYPLAGALVIAVIDVLPILGCGTVMLPWAVWEFIYGDTGRAAGLLVLLGIIYVVRQLLEPSLIGKMTGVHPFVALACLYLGWSIAGVGGMLAAPVVLLAVGTLSGNKVRDFSPAEKSLPKV